MIIGCFMADRLCHSGKFFDSSRPEADVKSKVLKNLRNFYKQPGFATTYQLS